MLEPSGQFSRRRQLRIVEVVVHAQREERRGGHDGEQTNLANSLLYERPAFGITGARLLFRDCPALRSEAWPTMIFRHPPILLTLIMAEVREMSADKSNS